MAHDKVLFEILIRLADDHLVLGHRLSEWCGHAPMLEEDLSMPNMALDLIGQARSLYAYAGEIENRGRDEDAIAYLRTEPEYKNLLLVEKPNEDFAHTMLRQFYFAVFMEEFWKEAISSSDNTLAGIAGKAMKEIAYHIRHCGEWIIRLGDGTEESSRRMRAAVEVLHPYTDEMFDHDDVVAAAVSAEIIPDPLLLRPRWEQGVQTVFKAAKITMPNDYWALRGGRAGQHGEEMGFLLADLQYMQRTYPGMTW
ncbi:MAG: phenylacetate-CoA oxygenase subunit PaaC [Rhizobiaceae bacterium]|nr:phenylacetate-CoA oxygenase subunit PaaC [Rhizobiaceae bacterium]